MLAGALQVALFFAAAASSLLPAEAAEDGVLLRGEKMTSEGFQFFFGAAAGQTYPVASSTDLLHWTALTNLSGPGGLLSVVDPDAPDFPQRFFRIGAIPTPITNMVYLPPGTFTMGSPAAETGHETNEAPRTVVTLSRGFWIAKYEVTQAEYTSLMGSNIALFAYDLRLPVDFATWFHATNYCQRLTETERAAGRLPAGYSYRLPTEAEWEYACRAGRTSPFGVGDGTSLSSTQANFDGGFPYGGAAAGPYLSTTAFGGTYPPNDWGLYDMHGNLWEWCQDWYGPYPAGAVTDPKGPATGTTRVLRGGGYTSIGRGCRAAKRDHRSPTYAHTIQGFRVVLAQDGI